MGAIVCPKYLRLCFAEGKCEECLGNPAHQTAPADSIENDVLANSTRIESVQESNEPKKTTDDQDDPSTSTHSPAYIQSRTCDECGRLDSICTCIELCPSCNRDAANDCNCRYTGDYAY